MSGILFSRGVYLYRQGVLIAYLGKNSFVLNEQKADKAGRISILDTTLYTDQSIPINLDSANIATEQEKILEELQNLVKI